MGANAPCMLHTDDPAFSECLALVAAASYKPAMCREVEVCEYCTSTSQSVAGTEQGLEVQPSCKKDGAKRQEAP